MVLTFQQETLWSNLTYNVEVLNLHCDSTDRTQLWSGLKKQLHSHHWNSLTCIHWKRRVIILLRATSCSTWHPRPSAKPLNRSRATIMKSLSGASYWSGCWLYIYKLRMENQQAQQNGCIIKAVQKRGQGSIAEWIKNSVLWFYSYVFPLVAVLSTTNSQYKFPGIVSAKYTHTSCMHHYIVP